MLHLLLYYKIIKSQEKCKDMEQLAKIVRKVKKYNFLKNAIDK